MTWLYIIATITMFITGAIGVGMAFTWYIGVIWAAVWLFLAYGFDLEELQ